MSCRLLSTLHLRDMQTGPNDLEGERTDDLECLRYTLLYIVNVNLLLDLPPKIPRPRRNKEASRQERKKQPQPHRLRAKERHFLVELYARFSIAFAAFSNHIRALKDGSCVSTCFAQEVIREGGGGST